MFKKIFLAAIIFMAAPAASFAASNDECMSICTTEGCMIICPDHPPIVDGA